MRASRNVKHARPRIVLDKPCVRAFTPGRAPDSRASSVAPRESDFHNHMARPATPSLRESMSLDTALRHPPRPSACLAGPVAHTLAPLLQPLSFELLNCFLPRARTCGCRTLAPSGSSQTLPLRPYPACLSFSPPAPPPPSTSAAAATAAGPAADAAAAAAITAAVPARPRESSRCLERFHLAGVAARAAHMLRPLQLLPLPLPSLHRLVAPALAAAFAVVAAAAAGATAGAQRPGFWLRVRARLWPGRYGPASYSVCQPVVTACVSAGRAQTPETCRLLAPFGLPCTVLAQMPVLI